MFFHHLARWWRQPSGLAEVLKLALPLVVSMISLTVMQFTDRVYLAWYSAPATAAALPAGALAFMVVSLPIGVAMYVNTFVSQYYGAGRHARIGPSVWQGVWIGLACWLPVLGTLPLAEPFFRFVGHGPDIAALEAEYYEIMCWGAGPMICAAALSTFYSGRGTSVPLMVVDSVAAGVNVVLDWLWIFGKFGFPEWGLAGAAWATVVSLWIKALIYIVLFLRPRHEAQYATRSGWRIEFPLFQRICYYGGPNGFQMLLEVGGFTVFLLLVGRLGELELAASSLAFNINSLAFMPVFGFGIATATLVGQRLGENRPDLASRATWSAFTLAVGCMLVVGGMYVFVPHWLLSPHELGALRADFGPVRDLTIVLLRFVAFYCVFDCMNVIFSSAIKGAGDTRFVLIVTTIMSGVPVFVTYAGIEWFGGGLFWSWCVVSAWVLLLGCIYFARFWGGKWKSMRVIEAAPPDLSAEAESLPAEGPLSAAETA